MAAQSLTMAELADRARALTARRSRTLLGITGAPGAGKSSVADQLAALLGERSAVVVGMDGFHLAQAELERLGRADRKGAPDTFDAAGFAALLHRLRANDEPVVHAPTFRRDLEEPVPDAVAIDASVPLVITEGNYLLLADGAWADVRRQLDEVWFLDVPAAERHRRLAARRLSFGVPEAEARRWTYGSDELNAELVELTRGSADLIIRVAG